MRPFVAQVRHLAAVVAAALSSVACAQQSSQLLIIPTANQPLSISTGDALPQDRIADLLYCDSAVAGVSAGCHLLRGTGRGTFVKSLDFDAGPLSGGIYTASFADYNASTHSVATLSTRPSAPQILTLSPNQNGTTYYGLSFAAPGPQPAIPGQVQLFVYDTRKYDSSKPADSTNYGFLAEDVANANLYSLNGQGVPVAVIPLANYGSGPFHLGDFDGDGLTDIAVLHSSQHVISIFRGTGGGTFASAQLFSQATGIFSMSVSDLNADGYPDLLVEAADGSLSVYLNGSAGFSQTPTPLQGATGSSTGKGGHIVGVADLNGDGRPDIITATPLGISVLLGQSPLSFTLKGIYDPGPGRSSFALADFNSDGHPDLAVDNPQGIAILFGQADGSFAAPRAITGTLTANPEPSLYGSDFALTAAFATPTGAPVPTGTVTFTVDGASMGSSPVGSNGAASFTIIAPAYSRGTHAIAAAYSGDATYSPLTLTGTHVISGLRSQTTFTLTTPTIFYGQIADGRGSVAALDTAANATVNGGTITFFDGATVICVLPINGTPGTCPAGAGGGFAVGVHPLTAMYSGNDFYAPSTSDPGNVEVLPDATSGVLASALNPSTVGQSITFTATFTAPYATPVGTVTFFDGASPIGSATLNAAGVATLTTATLALGTHNLTAALTSSLNFNGSVSTVVAQVVNAPALPSTSTVVSSSVNPSYVGQAVTFTATVTSGASAGSPAPGGNVLFTIDGSLSNPVMLNAQGQATLSVTSLTQGTHIVTATFGATATLAASTSAPLLQQVNAAGAGGFTLSVSPSTLQVPIGSSVSVLVTVTPLNGFAQAVTLGCTGLPNEATCTFTNATIPAGGGSTRLTVFAAAPHNCGGNVPYFVASGPTTLLDAILPAAFMLLLRRRRRLLKGITLALAIAILPALSGCANNCTDLGVRPNAYSFTVTGTSTGSPSVTISQAAQFTAHL